MYNNMVYKDWVYYSYQIEYGIYEDLQSNDE